MTSFTEAKIWHTNINIRNGIWADQKGVLYYTLLKPSETIYEDSYGQRLSKLKRGIAEKRPQFTTLIFLYDNTRPHTARPV